MSTRSPARSDDICHVYPSALLKSPLQCRNDGASAAIVASSARTSSSSSVGRSPELENHAVHSRTGWSTYANRSRRTSRPEPGSRPTTTVSCRVEVRRRARRTGAKSAGMPHIRSPPSTKLIGAAPASSKSAPPHLASRPQSASPALGSSMPVLTRRLPSTSTRLMPLDWQTGSGGGRRGSRPLVCTHRVLEPARCSAERACLVSERTAWFGRCHVHEAPESSEQPGASADRSGECRGVPVRPARLAATDNKDGTVGVGHDVLTHRAEQHAGEFAVAAAAHHQERGEPRQ